MPQDSQTREVSPKGLAFIFARRIASFVANKWQNRYDRIQKGARMQTMNISLPDPMKQFVEEQVNAGGYSYSTVSEYVRELVRADQKSKAKDQLEETLLDSLNSGDAIQVTPQMWNELRQHLRARARKRRSTKP
jgi:antitoxin ParD1/3/4